MDAQTEVTGMTSGGEDTATFTSLVERGLINAFEVLFNLFNGLEPHHRAPGVENLVLGLAQESGRLVPTATLYPHSVDVDTFGGTAESFNVDDIVDDFEVEVHGVNGNLMFTSVVLQGTSQETVSEIELVDPEVLRNLSVSPVLEEFKSFLEVLYVAGKGLETGVRLAHPEKGHLTVNHVMEGRLKISRQEHLSLNGSLNVL